MERAPKLFGGPLPCTRSSACERLISCRFPWTTAVEPGIFCRLERLAPAAEVLGQERLGAGVEVDPVLGPGEAVALVGVEDVGHAAAVLLDRGDDLLRLGLLDPRVVRALADQERPE